MKILPQHIYSIGQAEEGLETIMLDENMIKPELTINNNIDTTRRHIVDSINKGGLQNLIVKTEGVERLLKNESQSAIIWIKGSTTKPTIEQVKDYIDWRTINKGIRIQCERVGILIMDATTNKTVGVYNFSLLKSKSAS